MKRGIQRIMQRVAVQNGGQQSRSRGRALIGTLLALCIVCASVAAVWVRLHTPGTSDPASLVDISKPYTGHRSNEVPISSTRSLSMAEAHAPTSALPWSIVLDPTHGYVFVAEPGCEPLPSCPGQAFSTMIGQYSYADGTFIQDLIEPTNFTGPLFMLIDPAGHLWFTEPNSSAIGEYDPTNATWQQWPVAKNSNPYDLAFDARGNLWFTEMGGNTIGFLDTHTHTVVETPIPTAATSPYGITVDNKGIGWFAENSPNGQIGSFTTTPNGKIQIVEHAVDALRPHLITTDAAGNVWITAGFQGSITQYNPETGTSNRYRVYLGTCTNPKTCTGTHISGIYVANDGKIWFTDSLSQEIGYFIPDTGQVVVRTVPANSHPHDGLALDKNGRVWFTEQDALSLSVWPVSSLK